MKTVPFLNTQGETIGEATISADGSHALIKIHEGREAELLGTSCLPGLSLGYKFEVEKSDAGGFVYTSGDKNPLKDSEGRRLFVAQAVQPHKFVPSNPRHLCNVCGLLKHNHASEVTAEESSWQVPQTEKRQ
jgi:hypothetical protein